MDTNDLDFYVQNDDLTLGFIEEEHSIGKESDWGDNVTMSPDEPSKKFTLTIKANRHGSDEVADYFKDVIGGTPHCTADYSCDMLPDKLNFAIKGKLEINNYNGKNYYGNVVIAQGHNASSRNNWWIGGKEMIGTPILRPCAIALFHLSESTVKNQVDELVDDIVKKISTLFENVISQQDISTFESKIDAIIDGFVDKLINNIEDGIIPDFLKIKDDIEEALKNWATALKTTIHEKLSETGVIDKLIEHIIEGVKENFKKCIDESQAEILNSIVSALAIRFVYIEGSSTDPNKFNLEVLSFRYEYPLTEGKQ